MRSLLRLAAIGGGIALAVACGSTDPVGVGPSDGGATTPDGGGTTSGPSGLPCAVDAVLAANCRQCHGAAPSFGAPMPLMTHADLTAAAKSDPSKKVYELVAQRIASDQAPMPPAPNARLSAGDRGTIESWIASGAPSSTETCDGKEPPPSDFGVKCTPDLKLEPASAWEMPTDSGDEYVCWGVDLTRPTPTHVTAFVPRVDNTKIVHHIVLFESDAAVSSTPARCNPGGSLQWRMVMGWAPGGKGLELPSEAGFPIKTSGATHYVVQMHYSNPQGLQGEKDTSGFDLCTGPPRKHEADVMAFGTQSIDIPANPPNGGTYSRSCSVTVPSQLAGLHLIAAMPHMQQLGTAMSTKLTPAAGGPEVDLGTVNGWDFNTQAWLPIDATTQKDDVIRTTCTWKNTTGAPVGFGEDTADEMCYSFTLYYPRVQSPIWSWAAPALGSQCN